MPKSYDYTAEFDETDIDCKISIEELRQMLNSL